VISKKLNVKVVVLSSLYLLVVEMIFCMTCELFLDLDLFMNNIRLKFLLMIPIRLTEILLILAYNNKEKLTWDGCGFRTLKKLKKTK